VALFGLNTEIQKASQTLIDMQSLLLWRAALQQVAVAAIATTLLAVWWYVPPAAEIAASRANRDRLHATIDELESKGGRLKYSFCGQEKRFCVLIPKKPMMWNNLENRTETYVVPVGY
jgi:hypothetical protein